MNTDALTASPHFAALTNFICGIDAKMAKYWADNRFTFNSAPTCQIVSVGKRYAKLGRMEQTPPNTGTPKATSVYCFYDIATGDLLKAGTWKAPAPNGVRGNVNEPNVLDRFTALGPKGLR